MFYAEAAEDLRRNREQFIQNVRTSLRGGHVKGVEYDSVVTSSR
jgi:ubiquitin-conjugating enzyme E2 M